MSKLKSNLYDMKSKTLYRAGDEAPKGYKGLNLEDKEPKKEPKKDVKE